MKKNSQITAIGKYAMNLIETYFDENKPHRVFLVRGKHSFISSGAEYILSDLFRRHACFVSEFSDFQENPILEEVNNGCNFFEKSKSDIIIACGGGSVLDMAKLIRFKAAYDGDLVDSVFEKKKELTPLIACHRNRLEYSLLLTTVPRHKPLKTGQYTFPLPEAKRRYRNFSKKPPN